MGGVCSTYGVQKRCAYRVLVGKPEGKGHFEEDPGLDGRIILRRISRRDGKAWTGFIWPRVGMGSGLL
jgi:hypothetical protein